MKNLIQTNVLKARKPQTKEQFGYFLAGVIDADGHIEKGGNVCLAFHERELSVALYIKKIIGYGSIFKYKGSRSYRYRCCRTDKVKEIGNMIRHKLRHQTKIEQFNSRLVPKIGGEKTQKSPSISFENHWLAGFIQGDGSFQIQINNRGTPQEQVMIIIQISQKKDLLLQQIKNVFGGVLFYYKPQDFYYYTSSSIPNATEFVKYLDQYQVIGSSFKIYQHWRQAYFCRQTKQHTTELGRQRIIDLKASMSKLKMN